MLGHKWCIGKSSKDLYVVWQPVGRKYPEQGLYYLMTIPESMIYQNLTKSVDAGMNNVDFLDMTNSVNTLPELKMFTEWQS